MTASSRGACFTPGFLVVVLVSIGVKIAIRLAQGETVSEALCCTALATLLTLK